MPNVNGGEALVAALVAHGVDTVFGIPGTHNLAVYAALDTHGVKHILPRHEQGAGYAADGYARSTGRPGVVLTTTGPAILNAAAAAAQAYSDSIPVLFISPGMPLHHPALGNGYLHELKNQTAAMDAIVAYSHRITTIEEIPLAVAQAFTAMTSARPRPVHLEIPLDLLDQEAPYIAIPPLQPTPDAPLPQKEAAAALAVAELPVMVVGGGAQRATDELVRFAERVGAAVFTTANGKGAFPVEHPLHVGAGVQHPAVQRAVGEADLVVAIGTELAPSDWWSGLPELAGKLVRIDIDPASVDRNAPATYGLVGDCRRVLDELLTQLGDPIKDGTARAAVLREAHRADARAEGEPWLEMIAAIEAALPADAIVAADNAMISYYGALSNLPRRFLYPTGAGTLGYGLPAGIGAKVANPELPVLVLQGDGGIMFTVAELATAAELRLPLPIVVVDNGGYGEIRNEMADCGDPVQAVALGHPDFVALGKSLGCHGVQVAATELTEAIETALAGDRPTVIHIYETSRAAADLRVRTVERE